MPKTSPNDSHAPCPTIWDSFSLENSSGFLPFSNNFENQAGSAKREPSAPPGLSGGPVCSKPLKEASVEETDTTNDSSPN